MDFNLLKHLRRKQNARRILERREKLELIWMRYLIIILCLLIVLTGMIG